MQAIYFYALNDSFVTKHISLSNGHRVKVGRQTNNKTIPAERNGYFDSKVLSRQHAEVWEEGGKIFIRDVKSSNGTFINGERLSAEGAESDPFELKSDDIVEFGIDIVGEDNKTIIHHKVAARALCVFNEQDAQMAARAEAHTQSQASSSQHSSGSRLSSPANSSSFNFAPGPNDQQAQNGQRRAPMQQQGLGGMGGMGGNMRQPGKSGLTYEHIVSRLQGEVQKSKETGSELYNLTGTMNDIHDTLGGALPPNMPPYPQSLPPVRPPQPQLEASPPAPSNPDTNPYPPEVQSQLHDALSILDTHSSKLREVDDVRAEQDALKREMDLLREQLRKRSDSEREPREAHDHSRDAERDHGDNDYEDRDEFERERESEFESDGEDDDNASIHTVIPHELERVDEEDEEELAADEVSAQHERAEEHDQDIPAEDSEDRRRRRAELARPRTPEPSAMGMNEEDYEPRRGKPLLAPRRSTSPPSSSSQPTPDIINQLTERLTALSSQLEFALSLSTTLQAQHTAAQSTISALEGKVSKLEDLVQGASLGAAATATAEPEASHETQHESLTALLSEWKKGVEGQWGTVQEEWSTERERLSRAREEWEARAKGSEGRIETVESRLSTVQGAIASIEEKVGSMVGNVQEVEGTVRIVEALAKGLETNVHAVEEQIKSVESGLEVALTRVESGLAKFEVTSSQIRSLNATQASGLATPPSPRSLSSDSNRPRRRRRSTSGSSRGRSHSRSRNTDVLDGDASSTGTSVTSGSALFASTHIRSESPTTSLPDDSGDETAVGKRTDAARSLPTPDPSVRQLKTGDSSGKAKRLTDEQIRGLSTAVGFSVLVLAAAAVVWRVKPE